MIFLQVVNGVNYDLTVEVKLPDQPCKVIKFLVWDRFGALTLTESETLDEDCMVIEE